MTELDPRNSASPADSAPDEGLSPRAAAEAKKAAAAKAAAAAFIQSAGDDYGDVEAAQPRDVKKGQRTAVIVGLIICVLVGAGVLTYLFTSGFFNEQPVAEETQRVPLSDARVIAAFDEVAMDAPDISQYAYVSQDALIGPKFSDIVLNEPTNLGTPGNQIVTCEATATATFKNKGIEINVPVTLPFEYSNAGETWVPGDLVVGEATAVPLASASANDILANLNDILATNDPTYGEAMVDAAIVKTASDLSHRRRPYHRRSFEDRGKRGRRCEDERAAHVDGDAERGVAAEHRGLACHGGRCGADRHADKPDSRRSCRGRGLAGLGGSGQHRP